MSADHLADIDRLSFAIKLPMSRHSEMVASSSSIDQ